MTPAQALILVAVLVAVGLAAWATYRHGWRWGAGVLAGGLAALAGLWGLLRTLRPMPERPPVPRRPDAPLPEAEREREAVAVHESHAEEMARVKAIPDGEERRKELARLAAGKWTGRT